MLPFATSNSSFTRHLRPQRRPTWVLEICWWTAIPWRRLLVPWPLFLCMAWLFKFCLGVCLGSSQRPAANPPAPSWALKHFISLWSEKTTGDFALTEYWATITICINTLLCNTPAVVDWQRGIAQGLRQDYPESQGARVFSLTRSSWLVQTIRLRLTANEDERLEVCVTFCEDMKCWPYIDLIPYHTLSIPKNSPSGGVLPGVPLRDSSGLEQPFGSLFSLNSQGTVDADMDCSHRATTCSPGPEILLAHGICCGAKLLAPSTTRNLAKQSKRSDNIWSLFFETTLRIIWLLIIEY